MISNLTKDVKESAIKLYFDSLGSQFQVYCDTQVTLVDSLRVAYVVFPNEHIASVVFDVSYSAFYCTICNDRFLAYSIIRQLRHFQQARLGRCFYDDAYLG